MLKSGDRLTYLDGKTERTGIVWAPAPEAATYWVQPAPGARAVLVKVPSRSAVERHETGHGCEKCTPHKIGGAS